MLWHFIHDFSQFSRLLISFFSPCLKNRNDFMWSKNTQVKCKVLNYSVEIDGKKRSGIEITIEIENKIPGQFFEVSFVHFDNTKINSHLSRNPKKHTLCDRYGTISPVQSSCCWFLLLVFCIFSFVVALILLRLLSSLIPTSN